MKNNIKSTEEILEFFKKDEETKYIQFPKDIAILINLDRLNNIKNLIINFLKEDYINTCRENIIDYKRNEKNLFSQVKDINAPSYTEESFNEKFTDFLEKSHFSKLQAQSILKETSEPLKHLDVEGLIIVTNYEFFYFSLSLEITEDINILIEHNYEV